MGLPRKKLICEKEGSLDKGKQVRSSCIHTAPSAAALPEEPFTPPAAFSRGINAFSCCEALEKLQ